MPVLVVDVWERSGDGDLGDRADHGGGRGGPPVGRLLTPQEFPHIFGRSVSIRIEIAFGALYSSSVSAQSSRP